jgi:hypothetical protein
MSTPTLQVGIACALMLLFAAANADAQQCIETSPCPPFQNKGMIGMLPDVTNVAPNASPDSVLRNPQVFVDFWGWGCSSASDCAAKNLDPIPEIPALLDFLSNIGGSRYLNTVVQYSDVNGSAGNPVNFFSTANVWYSTDPLPNGANWPTTTQQSAEVAAAYNFFGIKNIAHPSDAIVILAMPPTVSGANECGNHSAAPNPNNGSPSIPYVMYPYQNQDTCYVSNPPYYTATFAANVTVSAFHEIAEAITDPRSDGGWDVGNNHDVEIADIACCTPVLTPLSPTASYYLPSLWSNAANIRSGSEFSNAVLSRATRFDQYVVNGGNIWHSWGNPNTYTASWSVIPNQPSGHSFEADVGAVSWSNNRVDLFALEGDVNLWHIWWDGSTWHWGDGGTAWPLPSSNCGTLYSPDVTSTQPGHLQVAVTCIEAGLATHVFVRRYTGSWQAWQDLGSESGGEAYNSGPAITAWDANNIHMFVKRADGTLWHLSSSDAGVNWSAPDSRGAPSGVTLVGDPDAAAWAANRLDVVIADNAGKIDHLAWDGQTFTWAWDPGGVNGNGGPSGKTMAINPSVTAMGDNRLWVSAVDSAGTVWDYGYDVGSEWLTWHSDSPGVSGLGVESSYW